MSKPLLPATASLLFLGSLALVASCTSRSVNPVTAGIGARRAILVSFDGLNERRALDLVPPAAIPTFRRLFSAGACAQSARPAFPSVTAPGHAALWTGTYGRVNGVVANAQPRLPRSTHSLLSNVSGYFVDGLRAEPLWITAGRVGLTVAAHHVTQAPGVPGYAGTDGPEPALETKREAAVEVLARSNVLAMNGYNVSLSPSLWLTDARAPLRDPGRWVGLDTLPSAVPAREFAWAVGADSLFGLLYGETGYDRVLLAAQRDLSQGTVALLADADPLLAEAERPLARHFAPPRLVKTARGTVSLTGRLFAVAPDASTFALYVPEMRVVQASNADALTAYLTATGGWFGNGGKGLYAAGRFGATVRDGGDGVAERRLLETEELVTRQYMRGAEWMWRARKTALLLDYFPLIDEIDHEWFGVMDPSTPMHDPVLASRLRPYWGAAWNLADRRLAALYALLDNDPDAALVVSGDHGMRSYWRRFRPNTALRNAGLLTLDGSGRVELSRTRAYSPNGLYVMLNRAAWRGGIVEPADESVLMDSVELALRAARAPEGTPIVGEIWRSDAPSADSLGLGGPAGGDVYFDLEPGFYYAGGVSGPLTSELASPLASHGFPSTRREMHSVLCLWGPAIAPRRIGEARIADASLVAADWLGIPHPADATGASPFPRLVPRSPGELEYDAAAGSASATGLP